MPDFHATSRLRTHGLVKETPTANSGRRTRAKSGRSGRFLIGLVDRVTVPCERVERSDRPGFEVLSAEYVVDEVGGPAEERGVEVDLSGDAPASVIGREEVRRARQEPVRRCPRADPEGVVDW